MAYIGCIMVAGASAMLSFNATPQEAVRRGAVPADPWWLAWLVPICLEFAFLVAAVVAWKRSSDGEVPRAELTVMFGLLALSVVVNVEQAYTADWLGRLLADLAAQQLPPRRPRPNPRVVKRKMSNFPLKRPPPPSAPPRPVPASVRILRP